MCGIVGEIAFGGIAANGRHKDVIDVATRIDWRSCLDVERRIKKLPLRHALARHVRHQTRAKRGFTIPMGAWLRGLLRPIFEEMVLGRTEVLGLAMDEKEVREVFNLHLPSNNRQP